MSHKYPRSADLQKAQNITGEAFVSWGGTASEQKQAFVTMGQSVDEFSAINRSKASFYTSLENLAPNVSARPGFSWSDYYRFRPDEAPPTKPKDSMRSCNRVYQNIGLVRNIIDLMGDFACQGIRVVHPNPRIEKFFQNWFERVKGKERSERFLNNLYRVGNVVVRKQTAKINVSTQDMLYRSSAAPDIDVVKLKVNSREIPWKYTFLDPTTIEVVGGPMSAFVGQPMYAIILPSPLRRIISSPKTSVEKTMVAQLPPDVIAAAKTRKPYLLPPEKTSVFHYKKDDWQEWALPMLHAVLDDINIIEKLKLADVAALDGAISKIRIFKLGSLEHKIYPTKTAVSKLAEILQSNVGGGTIDLIWGPDIELVESSTDTSNFLGEDKFKPHMTNLFGGLGIPPTLTGMGGASGTTNNYISLKTLMQRLEYGRSVLLAFWNNELLTIQKAMGFRFAAKIEFDINILGDEAAEKALLIQLADRNLISDEYLQYRFKHDPDMESSRISKEYQERNKGRMPPKASPYHDPQFGLALKKIALQTGIVAPGQVGLRKDAVVNEMMMYEPEEGEKNAIDIKGEQMAQQKQAMQSATKVGLSGRPKNAKDTKKRKTKVFKPKVKAALDVWADSAQKSVAIILNNAYLEKLGKKNMRQLTGDEIAKIERIKFDVFFNLIPMSNITEEIIEEALSKDNTSNDFYISYVKWVKGVASELHRELTMDEKRQVQKQLYTYYYGGQ